MQHYPTYYPPYYPTRPVRTIAEIYNLLKSGALYLVIGMTLYFCGSAIIMTPFSVLFVPALGITRTTLEEALFEKLLMGIFLAFALPSLIGAVLVLVGLIMIVIGLFMKFIPGISDLSRINHIRYSSSSMLIKIGFIGGFILLFVGVIMAIALIVILITTPGPEILVLSTAIIIITIISVVLLTIGRVGLVTLCLNLYGAEKYDMYLVAGVLFFIGLFFGLIMIPIDFIGWIILYLALLESVIKHSTAPPPPAQVQPQAPSTQ